MTTTSTWLQTKDHAQIGFVLVIEGTNLIYTSIENPNGAGAGDIKAAWAGTDWAAVTWRGGLQINGQMGQAIELFDPDLKPDSLTFSLMGDEVGSDTNIAQTLLRMASSTAIWTPLTADIDANDTTINVLDTSQFDADGDDGGGANTIPLYIGNETITYTGTTATTFTGVTRGKFNIWETNSSAAWATAHKIDTHTNAAPRISDTPTDSYNRGVALYVHHFEDGVWSTKANAKLIWAGRIKEITDDGNGFHVTAQNFLEVLARSSLLADQFTGLLAEGLWVTEESWRIRVVEGVQGVGLVDEETDLFSVAGRYTHREVRLAISEVLRASGTLGTLLTYGWGTKINSDGNVEIFSSIGGVGSTVLTDFRVYLHPKVWNLFGFESDDNDHYFSSGSTMSGLEMSRISDQMRLRAGQSPALYFPAAVEGSTIEYDEVDGSFITQQSFPTSVPSAVEGFLQSGDLSVYAVSKVSASTYLIHKDVSDVFASQGLKLSNTDEPMTVIRVGDSADRISVKQVWWEEAAPAGLLARILLSTGTASFNHSLDLNPEEMGIGVPASALDVDSFRTVGADKVTLFLTEPTPFAPWFKSILATSGSYVVWLNGKITVRRPRFDGSIIATSWSLTEGNKGGDPDGNAADKRSSISYGAESLINRFKLKYDADINGKFRRTATIQNIPSITSYGSRRTIEHKGLAIGPASLESWINNVVAAGLALFSKPITIVTRTYDRTLIEMRPLDTVSLTDDCMIDPQTGTRGVSSFPGVLLSTEFDWNEMEGVATIALLTDLDPTRTGPWAPSAMVDDTATNSGYVVATKTLTLYANKYSHSSQGADTDFFSAGDIIHIIELSPSNPASPTEWTRTIESTSGNTIVLTVALSTPAWDTAKFYVIEPTAIGAVVNAQKAEAFIADNADNSTGDGTNDAYIFGVRPDAVDDFTVTYTQRFRHMPDTADDTGNPFSIYKYHDAANSINNMLGYKTRNVSPQDALVVDETVTGTTFTLVYGPIWVPMYSIGRNLLVQLRGYVTDGGGGAGTGTFRVYLSSQMLSGASDSTTVYPNDVVSADFTTTSTTAEWIAEAAVTPWVSDFDFPGGAFVTIEAKNSISGSMTTVTSLSFGEDKI